MNIDKPNFDRNDIERIISSAVANIENTNIYALRKGNIIVIAAHSQYIDTIRDKIASMPEMGTFVMVELDDKQPPLSDAEIVQRINERIIEFTHQDIGPIPRFIESVKIKPQKNYVETKSKQVNNIQKKLQDGYSRAQFNQRKHMHNIIRIKHK